MGDNRVRCPSPTCGKTLGGATREGDVRVRLAITLVKADGTVHGPCSECGADVIVAVGGAPSDAVRKALAPVPVVARGRFVLNLEDLKG
jgi:hypothetical protein